jgi:hypothetical protein
MRAVALSDKTVQEKVKQSFLPVKVAILPGTKEFPLDWPAMQGWKLGYRLMGGNKNEGFTGCAVVSPDLKMEYANTGSGFVWEMFESTAYDAKKFAAMLDRAAERFAREQQIRADSRLTEKQRERALAQFYTEVRNAVSQEGRLHLPPKGFTLKGAGELFQLSGDLPKK